jgi:hypothetical protein
MPNRRITALLAATLAAGGIVAGVALGGEDRSREATVAERGAKVMPFSLDATTHVFDATATGGTQRVVADDPRDGEQIRLIREHLREEAAAFQRGDFADPASIHGKEMPGLAALQAGFERIKVSYRHLPDGAEIAYRTDDRALAIAVADWFDAQLRDHGRDATTGEDHSDSEHSSHSSHQK